MSKELTVSASIDFLKGKVSLGKAYGGIKIDVSGTDAMFVSQTIGTSEEAMEFGDITTPGYALYYNTDSTYYVEIRAGSGSDDVVKIPAGGIALFCFADAGAYAIAQAGATAGVHLLGWVVEA